ncbi:MAG: farnesyl diphosphate synthase [Pseudomonadota bacterium]
MTLNLESYLKSKKTIIESALQKFFEHGDVPTLVSSMNYSLLAGGKRVRPILTLTAYDIFNGKKSKLEPDYAEILPLACGIEMIHTYSLIHDDLPAMDNDDLRRGNPTNHKIYGDAVAILAGDALLTEAFTVFTQLLNFYEAKNVAHTIEYVARASGFNGMVGGQVLDIENDGNDPFKINEEYLRKTSYFKTGALITASVASPAVLLNRVEDVKKLEEYGKAIGLAFQVVDDVLGVTSTREKLGKSPNIDAENNKKTFVTIMGVDGAKKLAKDEIEKAKTFVSSYGKTAEPLMAIADYIILRSF